MMTFLSSFFQLQPQNSNISSKTGMHQPADTFQLHGIGSSQEDFSPNSKSFNPFRISNSLAIGTSLVTFKNRLKTSDSLSSLYTESDAGATHEYSPTLSRNPSIRSSIFSLIDIHPPLSLLSSNFQILWISLPPLPTDTSNDQFLASYTGEWIRIPPGPWSEGIEDWDEEDARLFSLHVAVEGRKNKIKTMGDLITAVKSWKRRKWLVRRIDLVKQHNSIV
jgi:hypothetical protein